MCGIGGIIKVTPAGEAAVAALAVPPREAIPEAWLDVLDESIRHRGPDGQGRFRDRVVLADGSAVDVALVHRRLSIIDHGGGAQPMVSVRRGSADRARSAGSPKPARGAMMPLVFHGKPDAAVAYEGMRGMGILPMHAEEHGQDDRATDLVAVVFNGCIYNHRELRRELQAAGHEFKTDHSDTEVLLHGWREWGEGLFGRIEGMFAVALWERASGRLVLVRDSHGEKPLYYTTEVGRTDGVAFSSSPPGLYRFVGRVREVAPKVDRGLSANWVAMGFESGTPSWDVQAVHPGAAFVFGESQPLEACGIGGGGFYANARVCWPCNKLNDCPVEARGRLDVERVDRLLRDSVEARLEADVPVGCFLSGGVDSSLISHYANEVFARGKGVLQTFTVRMPDARYDESAIAERVAAMIGTLHLTLDPDPHPAQDIVRLIQQMGLPFGDSSLLPAHWVSRAACQHVKVCLAGDGGDEMFLGYERHVADRWLRRWGGLLKAIPIRGGSHPKFMSAKLARLVNAARHGGYPELIAIFQHEDARTLLGDIPRQPNTVLAQREGFAFDRGVYLPEDLLRKSDSASMSVALELREPFLDRAISAACYLASESNLMPRGQRKGLLRQVARRYFPAEIVDRPKQGFAIPIGEWFRSDYGGMKQLLMDHLSSAEPWGPPRLGIELNKKFVRQMVDEHMNERRDHSQRLYMLLVLSIWARWMGEIGRQS